MKLTALLLPGFIFIAFSTSHSPSLSRSICNVSMLLSFMIFLFIILSSAKSLIFDSKSLQISFTHMRNRSGPNTLPCSTPDIALTSSYNCPPTLTLCEQPKMSTWYSRHTHTYKICNTYKPCTRGRVGISLGPV